MLSNKSEVIFKTCVMAKSLLKSVLGCCKTKGVPFKYYVKKQGFPEFGISLYLYVIFKRCSEVHSLGTHKNINPGIQETISYHGVEQQLPCKSKYQSKKK